MKLSDFLVEYLSNKGVDTVFSVTGGASAELNDAFHKSGKFKVHYAHNEASCSYMAEGYYRSTKKVAVCLVTVGPGATNLISGVYGCWVESIPVVIISGQSFLSQTIKNSGVRQIGTQEANIISTVKHFTKFSKLIENVSDFSLILNHSWSLMNQGRKGPIWLDIPADLQKSSIEINNLKNNNVESQKNTELDFGEIDSFIYRFLSKLDQSKRPIIHLGFGVDLSNSREIAKEFIEKLQIPFVLTHNSLDLFATKHKLNFGFPGIFGHRYANLIVQNSDLYLGLGTRLSLAQVGYNSKQFANKAIKFLVDIDKNELEKETLSIDYKLKTDLNTFLSRFLYLIKNEQNLKFNIEFKTWTDKCIKLRKRYDVLKDHKDFQTRKVNPYYFIRELSRYLNSKDLLFTDMGTSYQTTYQGIALPNHCRLITNTGYAPMGWGLPASLGARYGNKHKRVICLTGDGGLMMSLQDLASAPPNENFIIFVYNNGGYLTQRQTQLITFGRLTGVDSSSGLKFPNYKLIAKAFKFKYFELKDFSSIKQKLEEIMSQSKPTFVNIVMDIEQIQAPKLMNIKNKQGEIKQSSLENMWPFLSEKETKWLASLLKNE